MMRWHHRIFVNRSDLNEIEMLNTYLVSEFWSPALFGLNTF